MTITTMYPPRTTAKPKESIPTILVIEGLSGGDLCVEAAGGNAESYSPWQWQTIDNILSEGNFQGVLLTGGGDVDPQLYGQKQHARVYGVNQNRDLVEICVLARARELNIPVMGICRGAQIMAVEGGGSLIQHIEDHRGGRHLVYADKKSLFRKATQMPKMSVVSLHHQEIDDPGEFTITAWADDGTVEVIEDDRCIGVQFHPEMDEYEKYAQNLFRWLVVEAARRAKMPTPSTHWSVLRSWKNSNWKSKAPVTYVPSTVVKTDKTTGNTYVTKPASQSRRAGERTEPGRTGDSWWEDDIETEAWMASRDRSGQSTVSAWAAGNPTPLLLPGGTSDNDPDNEPKPRVKLHGDGRVELMEPKSGDHTVYSRHMCKFCGLIFDDPRDRDDHVGMGVCLEPDDNVVLLRGQEFRTRKEQIADERTVRSAAAALAEPRSHFDRVLAKVAGILK